MFHCKNLDVTFCNSPKNSCFNPAIMGISTISPTKIVVFGALVKVQRRKYVVIIIIFLYGMVTNANPHHKSLPATDCVLESLLQRLIGPAVGPDTSRCVTACD